MQSSSLFQHLQILVLFTLIQTYINLFSCCDTRASYFFIELNILPFNILIFYLFKVAAFTSKFWSNIEWFKKFCCQTIILEVLEITTSPNQPGSRKILANFPSENHGKFQKTVLVPVAILIAKKKYLQHRIEGISIHYILQLPANNPEDISRNQKKSSSRMLLFVIFDQKNVLLLKVVLF